MRGLTRKSAESNLIATKRWLPSIVEFFGNKKEEEKENPIRVHGSSVEVRYGGKRFLVASVIAIGRSLRNPWTLSPWRGGGGAEEWRGSSKYRTRACTIVHERPRTASVYQRQTSVFVRFASTISAPRLLFRLNKRARPSFPPLLSLTLAVNAIINYRSTRLCLVYICINHWDPVFAPSIYSNYLFRFDIDEARDSS